MIDYTKDKTGTDENKEYPRSDAASANKKLCPTLAEIVKHFFELHGAGGRGHSKRKYLGGLSLFTGLNVFRLCCFSLLQLFDTYIHADPSKVLNSSKVLLSIISFYSYNNDLMTVVVVLD